MLKIKTPSICQNEQHYALDVLLGEFYAIDFEFLQPYLEDYPYQIEDAIEVRGITPNYNGDLPEGFTQYNSNFNRMWAPYIGKW